MCRTKGMQGFTLYPDKAYIEVKAAVYNRTAFPQTFLWWANPAIAAGEHYRSVFPPDVHAVFDHGKRDVSTFPIATRSEEHTSELQSLMRISYAVFCLKKKNKTR